MIIEHDWISAAMTGHKSLSTETLFFLFSALGSLGDCYFSLPGPRGAAHPWGHSARGLEGRGLLSQT